MQTVTGWLQKHPEITIISRDRWSEYATAAQKGAPQARQVADRWHLLHNLTEQVSALFTRIRSEVKAAEPARKKLPPSASQAKRETLFLQIRVLHQQGLNPEQIAWQVGVSERTIYRWLEKGRVPSGEHSSRSASMMNPYQCYMLKRWQEGHRKGSELYRERKRASLPWLRTRRLSLSDCFANVVLISQKRTKGDLAFPFRQANDLAFSKGAFGVR